MEQNPVQDAAVGTFSFFFDGDTFRYILVHFRFFFTYTFVPFCI